MLNAIRLDDTLDLVHGKVHARPEKFLELDPERMFLVQMVFPDMSPRNLFHLEPAREILGFWILEFVDHVEVTKLQGDHEKILVLFIVAWVERATDFDVGVDFEETTTLFGSPILEYLDYCITVVCSFVDFREFPFTEEFACFRLIVWLGNQSKRGLVIWGTVRSYDKVYRVPFRHQHRRCHLALLHERTSQAQNRISPMLLQCDGSRSRHGRLCLDG